jgi:hypothetical protein
MSKVSKQIAARRAVDAEAFIAEVNEKGGAMGRRAGFTTVSLTRDGICRSTVVFMGMGQSVTTRGVDAREALTKAYEFHDMKVDGFHVAGRW